MNLQTTSYKIILKDGTLFDVDEQMVIMFEMAYPRINVREELGKMVAWHFSNESRRKTRRGIKRSINSWLNAARPTVNQSGMSQRDHAKQTTIADRVTDISWADGL